MIRLTRDYDRFAFVQNGYFPQNREGARGRERLLEMFISDIFHVPRFELQELAFFAGDRRFALAEGAAGAS